MDWATPFPKVRPPTIKPAFRSRMPEEKSSEALSEPALQPFSDWSRLSVWLLTESQLDDNDAPISLLWSDLSAIDPKSPVTREEAADLLCAVLEHTGILPA